MAYKHIFSGNMRGAVLSASVGFPQQPLVQVSNESGSLNPVLPISFIKKQDIFNIFELNRKNRESLFPESNPGTGSSGQVPDSGGLIHPF